MQWDDHASCEFFVNVSDKLSVCRVPLASRAWCMVQAREGIDMSNIQATVYFIYSCIGRHFLHGRWSKDEGKLVICSDGIVVLRIPCTDASSAREKAERMMDGMTALGRK